MTLGSRIFFNVSICLASCFYLSYLPAALVGLFRKSSRGQTLIKNRWTGAGLVGAFVGAGTYLILPNQYALSFVAIAIGIGLSVFISHFAEKALNSHDDSRIVIDEWIGVWIALWGLPQIVNGPFILAFVLFRFFDVWKGPWGRALSKLPGGWGVTMDDVFAGILANVVTRFIAPYLF